MVDLPEYTQRQIDSVREGRSSQLNLGSDYNLKEFPEVVFTLENLEVLYLGETPIEIIPDKIRDLPNLKKLDLQWSPIRRVPDIPGLLLNWDTYLACYGILSPENITGLRISSGHDKHSMKSVEASERLSIELSHLVNISELRIGLRQMALQPPEVPSELEPALGMLHIFSKLTYLSLWGFVFRQVPLGVRTLRQLTSITMTGLEGLPDWMDELHHLKNLNLHHHRFVQIPDVVFRLKGIETLDLTERPPAQAGGFKNDS